MSTVRRIITMFFGDHPKYPWRPFLILNLLPDYSPRLKKFGFIKRTKMPYTSSRLPNCVPCKKNVAKNIHYDLIFQQRARQKEKRKKTERNADVR